MSMSTVTRSPGEGDGESLPAFPLWEVECQCDWDGWVAVACLVHGYGCGSMCCVVRIEGFVLRAIHLEVRHERPPKNFVRRRGPGFAFEDQGRAGGSPCFAENPRVLCAGAGERRCEGRGDFKRRKRDADAERTVGQFCGGCGGEFAVQAEPGVMIVAQGDFEHSSVAIEGESFFSAWEGKLVDGRMLP